MSYYFQFLLKLIIFCCCWKHVISSDSVVGGDVNDDCDEFWPLFIHSCWSLSLELWLHRKQPFTHASCFWCEITVENNATKIRFFLLWSHIKKYEVWVDSPNHSPKPAIQCRSSVQNVVYWKPDLKLQCINKLKQIYKS